MNFTFTEKSLLNYGGPYHVEPSSKSMDRFLYDRGLHHERVKKLIRISKNHYYLSFFDNFHEDFKNLIGFTAAIWKSAEPLFEGTALQFFEKTEMMSMSPVAMINTIIRLLDHAKSTKLLWGYSSTHRLLGYHQIS